MSQAEDPRRLNRKADADEVSVEDVRQLMGAATPHFALQLRNRIANLISDLPEGHPARVEGEREIARLESLGFTGENRGEGANEFEQPARLAEPAAAGRRRLTRRGPLTSALCREDALASRVQETGAQQFVEEREHRPVDREHRDVDDRWHRGGRGQSEHHDRVQHDHREQREHDRVRAVAAQVLSQADLDGPDHDRGEPGDQQRAAVREAPANADDRADRADEDQDLGRPARVPRGLGALAEGPGVPEAGLGARGGGALGAARACALGGRAHGRVGGDRVGGCPVALGGAVAR